MYVYVNVFVNCVQVNERLQAMDVKFMDGKSGPKNYDAVGSGDVVILPAFGATIQEMQLLDEKYFALHTL